MKPGTYTQLYIQLVFAVKNREAALHKSIIVNRISDHVHILIGLNPSISFSKTVHDIKRNSSLFINKENLCYGKFNWQEGYGGFSYSRSQLNNVYNYILNQENHHKKLTFKKEYFQFLKKHEIEYNEKNLFDFWKIV